MRETLLDTSNKQHGAVPSCQKYLSSLAFFPDETAWKHSQMSRLMRDAPFRQPLRLAITRSGKTDSHFVLMHRHPGHPAGPKAGRASSSHPHA